MTGGALILALSSRTPQAEAGAASGPSQVDVWTVASRSQNDGVPASQWTTAGSSARSSQSPVGRLVSRLASRSTHAARDTPHKARTVAGKRGKHPKD